MQSMLKTILDSKPKWKAYVEYFKEGQDMRRQLGNYWKRSSRFILKGN